MKLFTKKSLIAELIRIRQLGWIPNARPGNAGGVGNTLEDLLGISENNLPLPNAAEWELKCQRAGTSSLTTLFHMEPSPRALKFVPAVLLLKYGWPHQGAGRQYPATEMSFRQTISGGSRTDRGFGISVDRQRERVVVSFDARSVHQRHSDWLASVESRVGLGELEPQPYWGFCDLLHKAGSKLPNCFYVRAETKRSGGVEYLRYTSIMILQGLSLSRLVDAIAEGDLLVDFDARTGHNHGTKFRLRQERLPRLYSNVTEVP